MLSELESPCPESATRGGRSIPSMFSITNKAYYQVYYKYYSGYCKDSVILGLFSLESLHCVCVCE